MAVFTQSYATARFLLHSCKTRLTVSDVPNLTVSREDRKASRAAALADLRAACRLHGITQDEIADAAKVSRPLVVNVFSGRDASRNVVDTARCLVADAERRLARARKRAARKGLAERQRTNRERVCRQRTRSS